MKRVFVAGVLLASHSVWAGVLIAPAAVDSSAPLAPIAPLESSAPQVQVLPADSSAPLLVLPPVTAPVMIEAAPVPAPFRVDYHCNGAQKISVLYPPYADADTKPIKLEWKGKVYRLKLAMSASGARYASSQLVWWTKGDTAFLSTRGGRMLVRGCEAQ